MVRLEMEGRPCWCEVEDGEAMAAVVGCQEEETSLGGGGGGIGAKAMEQ